MPPCATSARPGSSSAPAPSSTCSGPLSNPAGTTRQLIGVFHRQWTEPMAKVLAQLGSERAWVVHGSDGLDEITTTGATYVAELRDGEVPSFEVTPEDAGLPRADPSDLKGGDPGVNAAAVIDMLSGRAGPLPRHRAAQRRRRPGGRRQGRRPQGGRGPGGRGDRIGQGPGDPRCPDRGKQQARGAST